MRTFYHATPVANLEAILRDGLEPRIGPRSVMIGEEAPAIYFFDDPLMLDDAIGGWLGDALEEDSVPEIAILAFSEEDLDACVLHDGLSCSYTGTIPPSAIRVLRTEPLDP